MREPFDFSECLSLVETRSEAFREAVRRSTDLGERVPGCPAWSLRDLVIHLGQVHLAWSLVVLRGPADAPPDQLGDGAEPSGDLLEWSRECTDLYLSRLREAGPDRGCWGWWSPEVAALSAATVARHQVLEVAVHTFDAQEAVGVPEPVPTRVALDGVEEFVTVGLCSMGPWPHQPATVRLACDEGPVWSLELTDAGTTVDEGGPDDGTPPDLTLRGSASELLLALHSRSPMESLEVEGDRKVFEQLRAWPPLSPDDQEEPPED
ncbi:maleylpyruvate isomerase family mycothiol-dependent enzyme [Streptomyces sp. NPDC005438]|uniref:maleylpyruvate isomerase family mycothiol-dependent enzyme n=1 Tax=Streptomyces sp. NPDC005438 TaxID=3156880 RepID=UPI0033BF46C4